MYAIKCDDVDSASHYVRSDWSAAWCPHLFDGSARRARVALPHCYPQLGRCSRYRSGDSTSRSLHRPSATRPYTPLGAHHGYVGHLTERRLDRVTGCGRPKVSCTSLTTRRLQTQRALTMPLSHPAILKEEPSLRLPLSPNRTPHICGPGPIPEQRGATPHRRHPVLRFLAGKSYVSLQVKGVQYNI